MRYVTGTVLSTEYTSHSNVTKNDDYHQVIDEVQKVQRN